MQLALNAARADTHDLHRFVALPRELTGRPSTSDLTRLLRAEIDRMVVDALFVASPEAFEAHVVAKINDFVSHTQVLMAQVTHTGSLPRTTNQAWLVDVLGNGADIELEFCEATLWSSYRRLAKVDLSTFASSTAREAELGRKLATAAYVGLFCWLVVQRSAAEIGPNPAAVRAALRMLRSAAMDTAVGVAHFTAPPDEPTLTASGVLFDDEDLALAMDDS